MSEAWVQSQGWEDPLEKERLHSNILAWRIPWTVHETSARGWCTGKTQRDGMGREAGGGIRMGNTCKSTADACQCVAKTTTIL